MSPRRPANLPAAGHRTDLRIITRLLPYLWSRAATPLRVRVVLAVLCLVAAKIATVIVPLFYKQAVDALSHPATLVAVPAMLIVAYGAARVIAQGLNELRQMVFAKVAQNAVHVVALETFQHMHRLSLRFHLDRQTGGLSRAIERGTTGIDNLLHFLLFQIVPTLLEIGMVSAILWWFYDWRFAAVTFVTIIAYIAYTLSLTQWRLKFRRRMLEAETEANTKAIDSLINYETVKYFGNEGH
jgi:ABC-type multidrug transport system fused ATPase/permease subunit